MRIKTRVYLVGCNYNNFITMHYINNVELDIRINSKTIFIRFNRKCQWERERNNEYHTGYFLPSASH